MRILTVAMTAVLMVGGCAASNPQTAADLTTAFDIAAAAGAIYAARPGVDPKTAAHMTQLLAAAQAALIAWQTSPTDPQRSAASIAIAALVAYEATGVTSPHPAGT